MKVTVVGGGVSGMTAAFRLRQLLGPTAEIDVIEQRDRIGGVLHTVELAGVPFDVGSEAFLVRRPEATDLVAELGMSDQLRTPTPAAPSVRAAGRTVALPTRTLLGLPASAAEVSDVLSADGTARYAAEADLPLRWVPGADVAVGALVRARAGDEVVDRLLDPLLGGVYAGRADALGLRATLPQLATALDAGAPSLQAAAASLLPAPATDRPPVFGTLRGGLGTLVDELRVQSGARIRTGVVVRELDRTGRGWRLTVDRGRDRRVEDADGVVLAVPAPALRRLLDGLAPDASRAAAAVEVASTVLVGLALPAAAAEGIPAASGVLIASGEPFGAKAFTYSSRKWSHLQHPDLVLVRGSIGRHGEADRANRPDSYLIDQVRDDLAALTGVRADPVDAVVMRWGGGLPQYQPGHLDLVRRIEAGVAEVPRLAVAGATLHGVGIPACIATATAAARRIADQLAPDSSRGASMEA